MRFIDIVRELSEFVVAIGIYGSFIAYVGIRPSLDTMMFVACFGLIVYLITVLETMDDRWL